MGLRECISFDSNEKVTSSKHFELIVLVFSLFCFFKMQERGEK